MRDSCDGTRPRIQETEQYPPAEFTCVIAWLDNLPDSSHTERGAAVDSDMPNIPPASTLRQWFCSPIDPSSDIARIERDEDGTWEYLLARPITGTDSIDLDCTDRSDIEAKDDVNAFSSDIKNFVILRMEIRPRACEQAADSTGATAVHWPDGTPADFLTAFERFPDALDSPVPATDAGFRAREGKAFSCTASYHNKEVELALSVDHGAYGGDDPSVAFRKSAIL